MRGVYRTEGNAGGVGGVMICEANGRGEKKRAIFKIKRERHKASLFFRIRFQWGGFGLELGGKEGERESGERMRRVIQGKFLGRIPEVSLKQNRTPRIGAWKGEAERRCERDLSSKLWTVIANYRSMV